MFVYNFKVNGKNLFKCFFIITMILIVIIVGIVTFKIFYGASHDKNKSSCLPQSNVSTISSANYTNVLKAVHDNIDSYVGLKINFVGYVYRVSDLKENQFVLARDMIISSNRQYVVVGFLAEYENAKDFENNTWVNVTGEITKGDYHGDMPIVKVTEMKETSAPNEEYVYPPDESYIPTDGVI